MKFIITDFFEKQFNKIVSDMSINDLVLKININSKNFINFKDPYVKIKLKTNNKTYRLVIVFDKNELIILFINIFDKKDKNYGENLSWDIHKKDILNWKDKNQECLISGKYYNIYL
ncbi:MAG: hypothetical protein PHG82_05230 [Candidatus Gracilibacteria bacterium]|nr:hypothetical protein [Candidatus Gracilibacteria bacterium]